MSDLPTAKQTIDILESDKGAGRKPGRTPDPLFGAVVEVIRRHFYFEEEWHYLVAALFVFQAHVAPSLPAVFYIFIGASFGKGKTTLLNLLARLTGGLLFENISVAALARSMEDGRTACLDEIDVSRGREYDEVRDALMRQGYKRDAAPYVRWDPTSRDREEVPIFGPKAATYRGTLDDALRSRGFNIPTARPIGEVGYDLVLANMWPDLRKLPSRLKDWGKDAQDTFSDDWVRMTALSPTFREKVRRAVGELGANRESELATIALLVAEMVGVDVEEELRKASELTQTLTGEGTAEELEELVDIVLECSGQIQEKLLEDAPEVRLVQRDIKSEMNRRRKDRGERPIWDKRFAILRREAGVKDSWIRRPGNRVVWALPAPFLGILANKANMPNLEIGSKVSQVSQVSRGDRTTILLLKVLEEKAAAQCRYCGGHRDGKKALNDAGYPVFICRVCWDNPMYHFVVKKGVEARPTGR